MVHQIWRTDEKQCVASRRFNGHVVQQQVLCFDEINTSQSEASMLPNEPVLVERRIAESASLPGLHSFDV